jgi:hypothetical protein
LFHSLYSILSGRRRKWKRKLLGETE